MLLSFHLLKNILFSFSPFGFKGNLSLLVFFLGGEKEMEAYVGVFGIFVAAKRTSPPALCGCARRRRTQACGGWDPGSWFHGALFAFFCRHASCFFGKQNFVFTCLWFLVGIQNGTARISIPNRTVMLNPY